MRWLLITSHGLFLPVIDHLNLCTSVLYRRHITLPDPKHTVLTRRITAMAEKVGLGTIDTEAEENIMGIREINASDFSSAMRHFTWVDYFVFSIMLGLCMAIGIYYSLMRSTYNSQDYLVGGRTMKTFPVSMSLIASFTSGISLLGIPTEIYIYGIQYLYISFGLLLTAIVMHTVYIPVFHDLKITSTYEYLERRFDKRVRILASILFIIALCVWLPIVIYVPALAFNQVTGLKIHWVTTIVCTVCIFYTSVGGIQAVVITDLIQTILMYGAILIVIIKGTIDIGGLRKVIDINLETGRIEEPNFDISPFTRHTFWSLTIGGFVYFLQTSGVNQNMVQRYLALPTLTQARIALWQCSAGIFVMTFLCSYTGLLIFATFSECDPLAAKLVKQKDQLLPILVVEVLGNYPGLTGLFVAGIFSAALSSLSTGLNSTAAVVLEDCCKSFLKKELSEKETHTLMKLSVLVMGIICVCLVFVVEKLGTVLQLTMSIGPIANGPSLALFTMGILLPWINSKGAFYGSITGLIVMSLLTARAQFAIASGNIVFPEKPITVTGCSYDFISKYTSNMPLYESSNTSPNIKNDEMFDLYRLSYLWYTLLGALVSIFVATIITFLTGPLDPKDIDPTLLAPFVRRLIPPRKFPNQPKATEIIYAYKQDMDIESEKNIDRYEESAIT
ncbi:Sodium:solute symporter family [Popillia japonica]|uniref:Sodium:solute symporter family n=1 Tax=Popillia japonica TaxID=7064 RepID=A0AAW1I8U9_POPJA